MANLSCGATMAKYILCLFNVVFFLCGAVILGVSLWVKFDDNASSYMKVIEFDKENPFLDVALNVLIVVGVFIFVTGFLGCYGAWKENSCMLNVYAVNLVIVLIGQIVGIGCALHFRSKLDDHLKDSMSDQAHNHVRTSNDYALTQAWNALQFHFKCCGGTGYSDYANSRYANVSETQVPKTCCELADTNINKPSPVDYDTCQDEAKNGPMGNPPQLHQEGCYDALTDFLFKNITIVIGVIFGIILIEIFGIIFACCVKKELTEYKHV